jgi:CBS domain-containing protein
VAIEMIRASPYHAVPIVDDAGRFVGMATEAALSRSLLAAGTPEERARVREMPIADIAEPAHWWAVPMMTASEVIVLFDRSGRDVLPVLGMDGVYCGLIGRGDLVRELSRPFNPPSIGGMATPLGVYLTTGRVSGGVGIVGLMLNGLTLFALLLTFTIVSSQASGMHLVTAASALLARVPGEVRTIAVTILANLLVGVAILVALRLSPVAGFHAAEHQVVHAIERGEPLMPENVRAMPRVHPRCGTNLVAGFSLFGALYGALGFLPPSLSAVVAGAVALSYWRQLGSWLQTHFTTRPAKPAEIDSAIRAAHEVLDRHNRAPDRLATSSARLLRTGMLQVMLGFAVGIGITALLAWLSPPLGVILNPVLRDFWSS